MYPPIQPTILLEPQFQPPTNIPMNMPIANLQAALRMHMFNMPMQMPQPVPEQLPMHVQMPMVCCPLTREFIPVPATSPEAYHKVTYEGQPGEFHCMKCVRICDYINNIYCCDEARNKNPQKKKCDSYFLQMCFIQAAMRKMVEALVANKAILNEDGSCFFCRNATQHKSGWCRSKSIVQLFNHAIVNEERKMYMWLNKYLELRKAMSIAEMETNLNITTGEMEGLVKENPNNLDLKLQLHRHRRGVRHAISNEEKFLDKENEGIYQRFVKNFKAKREESVGMLTTEGKIRDAQVNQLAFQMRRLGN